MRHFIVLVAALTLTASSFSQDKPPPDEDRPPLKGDPRRYFTTPRTAPEFWRALRFEIEIGKFDVAAEYLRGFLAKNPTDEELLQIEAKEGMNAFLRLLTIPRWSADPKLNAEAQKNAHELVSRVNTVVRKQLGDPKRIAKFIQNLRGDEEQRTYAIGELRKSGALAVPALIAEMVRTLKDPDEHQDVVSALPFLSADAAPALIAALDVNNATIRTELIDLFIRKSETRAVPYLWYLSAAADQPEAVRMTATAALKRFLPRQAGKLPPAYVALTAEADRYARHQVPFADPQAVTVWQWNGQQLSSEVVTASQAEEYYGLRLARQALALQPDYQPAQLVFLGLAVDKGFERGGLDQPLTKGAPQVKELLGTANSELLLTLLEQALADQRTGVILGTVRVLGDRAETTAVKAAGRGSPALVRALYYPDRRVQIAAAEAILRIPGAPAPVVSTRIVEILGHAIGSEPEAKAGRPKALIAFANEDDAHAVSQAADGAGFDAVRVHTGRAALRRLNEASDIDLLVVEASLPEPGLDSLLSQLRADINVGRLPLFLVAPTGTEPALRQLAERHRKERDLLEESKIRERFAGEAQFRAETLKRLSATYAHESERLREAYRRRLRDYPNVWVMNEGLVRDAGLLKAEAAVRFQEAKAPPLTEAERQAHAAEAILWLARLARKEVSGYDIEPAEGAVLRALRSNELAIPAAEAAARLGPKAQRELAMVLLDGKRPVDVRAKAAEELMLSLQLRGSSLLPPQVEGLHTLYKTTPETKIKITVAQVLGSLRPTSADTGRRLQGYVPPLKVPVEEAPKPKAAPEKEGK